MRTAIVILLSGVLMGVGPEDPQREVAALKIQVRALERQLAMTRAAADRAGGPVLRMPNAPKAYWVDPDLFAEHIKVRDILGLCKPADSPKAWLVRNKGFVGQTMTWRGVVVNDVSRSGVVTTEVAAGKHGMLTLQVLRGKRTHLSPFPMFKKGAVVAVKGTIESILIEPTLVVTGQPVHGTITIGLKGSLQGTQPKDKR